MWVTLTLISIVGIAAVGYVVWPLFGRTEGPVSSEGEQLADLLTRKEVALEAIRELEFDHGVGKIEDADFERFNRILRNRALRLIELIDARYGAADSTRTPFFQLSEGLEHDILSRRRVEELPPNESGGRLQEE
ncbi:MAG: hypothetical protein F4047_11130 [Caldilineaceae bacterium SB0670_bin_27]|uniref:C-type cytochrome biogenesis protein CcmI n=1 Tax=Caldilineaceae bacterium SB0664_bin_27 TaxID=2605260 RepID=A0A6B0YSM2_9CHLR|nr:hypothetical protein [Caldilineaceae bacterium SB0664_bin_27]MYJ78671.1 hypothetical protein [Caldilineaceae bacterium SB0670_bin_27]